jgi:RNA processing factor Prp31
MLAAKISIAARVDAFEGTPWGDDEVNEVEAKVTAIRNEFSHPPGR